MQVSGNGKYEVLCTTRTSYTVILHTLSIYKSFKMEREKWLLSKSNINGKKSVLCLLRRRNEGSFPSLKARERGPKKIILDVLYAFKETVVANSFFFSPVWSRSSLTRKIWHEVVMCINNILMSATTAVWYETTCDICWWPRHSKYCGFFVLFLFCLHL